jgi:hypothetical protein
VHVGEKGNASGSKSEVGFFAAAMRTYQHVDLLASPPVFVHEGGEVVDLSDIPVGEHHAVPCVGKFRYLGSMLANTCTDVLDVDARIAKAGAAFGALHKCLFASKEVSWHAKRTVYKVLILSILLYGCESWCLTQVMWRRLRTFHALCVRKMCRVTRYHTWKHRVSTSTLLKRVGLRAIESYVYRRQLGWLGHVSRMKYSRMPRWLLSCWVANPRPVGAPNFTYGRGVQAALEYAGLGEGDGRWVAQAGDREEWREMLKGLGQEAWEEEQGAADRQQQQQQQQRLQQHQQQTPAQRQQQQQQEQQQQRQLRAYRRQFRGDGGV